MNRIILQGQIKNIQYSHNIADIEFYKADILVPRTDGKEDIINLKFKRFSNIYKENDKITLVGNVRTFSTRLADKNKVEVFTFTYFDEPDIMPEDISNIVYLSGKICKSNGIKKTQTGKDVMDFILANNLDVNGKFLNCYIPCVAWGKFAKQLSNKQVGDEVAFVGQLQSREYKKKLENGETEIHVAHEVSIKELLEPGAFENPSEDLKLY